MTAYHRLLTLVGAVILGFWVLVASLASFIAPFDPNLTIFPLAAPVTSGPEGSTFWFGTDYVGRDILSRVVWAAHNNMALVGSTVVVAYLFGFSVAWVATARNWLISTLASGVTGIARAVPVFISYIILGHAQGFGVGAFMVAFVLGSLPSVMDTLTIWRESPNASNSEPRTRTQIIAFFAVDALKRFAFYAAVAEAIAFVFLGPLPPSTATFGSMIGETRQMALSFPHMVSIPIAAFVTLLLGASLLAFGLEGLLPPSLRSVDPAKPSYRPA